MSLRDSIATKKDMPELITKIIGLTAKRTNGNKYVLNFPFLPTAINLTTGIAIKTMPNKMPYDWERSARKLNDPYDITESNTNITNKYANPNHLRKPASLKNPFDSSIFTMRRPYFFRLTSFLIFFTCWLSGKT